MAEAEPGSETIITDVRRGLHERRDPESISCARGSWSSMLLVVVVTIMSAAVLLVVVRRVISTNDATCTSIFQDGVRFNTHIMLAVSQSLFGAEDLAMGSVGAGSSSC